ncbi:Imm26 family immunity protein [Sphaerisporangium sp. NPDC005289]|uniref:Imm26 family immunity protein n=1 Tax=Sphaerisporangium sp. NPDC005289 TaxID=3155247 RepID=UPI0033B7C290
MRKSRVRPRTGDVFALDVENVGHVFGRVMLAGLPEEHPHTSEALLCYIYSLRSPERFVDAGDMKKDELLIPPFFINSMPWRLGYFETIGHAEPTEVDLLPRHCFYSITWDSYYDEWGNKLKERYEPCGVWGIRAYGGIDVEVSKALGITSSP